MLFGLVLETYEFHIHRCHIYPQIWYDFIISLNMLSVLFFLFYFSTTSVFHWIMSNKFHRFSLLFFIFCFVPLTGNFKWLVFEVTGPVFCLIKFSSDILHCSFILAFVFFSFRIFFKLFRFLCWTSFVHVLFSRFCFILSICTLL